MSGLVEQLAARWPGVTVARSCDGIDGVAIHRDHWRELAQACRDGGFSRFLDLTAVDDPERTERFEIVLLLHSPTHQRWLRLRTFTAASLPSVVPVFEGANWYEREVFDLFGVQFDGHPDLRRILMPDDYPTHPLRRDHPLGNIPVEFTVTQEGQDAP